MIKVYNAAPVVIENDGNTFKISQNIISSYAHFCIITDVIGRLGKQCSGKAFVIFKEKQLLLQ